jgi:hypothetical protein
LLPSSTKGLIFFLDMEQLGSPGRSHPYSASIISILPMNKILKKNNKKFSVVMFSFVVSYIFSSHIFCEVIFYAIIDFMVIQPSSLFPSVRCGLEMAILNVIAARQSSSLLNILQPQMEEGDERSSKVKICALIDSNGTPSEVAYAATTLVEEGFTAIKLKVS